MARARGALVSLFPFVVYNSDGYSPPLHPFRNQGGSGGHQTFALLSLSMLLRRSSLLFNQECSPFAQSLSSPFSLVGSRTFSTLTFHKAFAIGADYRLHSQIASLFTRECCICPSIFPRTTSHSLRSLPLAFCLIFSHSYSSRRQLHNYANGANTRAHIQRIGCAWWCCVVPVGCQCVFTFPIAPAAFSR